MTKEYDIERTEQGLDIGEASDHIAASVLLPISDEVCRDFLTQCVESASSYWLSCDSVKRDGHNIIEVIGCSDAEDDETKWGDANLDTIRLGIQRILAPGANVASNIKTEVLASLIDPGSSAWDDWTCDACLQFGLLGELVYG